MAGNLAAIARTHNIEPVDPDDPAMAFMPPLASVEELSSSGAAPMPEADAGTPKIDNPPLGKVEFPTTSSSLSEPLSRRGEPAQKRRASPARLQETASQSVRLNKAESADYTRVTLRLHNDVITRLVAHGLSRSKRYTTVIEDFIMAGLDRHND
ncbi:hypothetical protein [Mesorhizobium sp. SP-1A]|uniref:hypothetical protein n=1 Tax=Mesorhizobium sp. SP-1A TaxID=3077840 RepID=UPI0028F6EE70|nr:hypothetical protein [Mesorhizobium sp. SP-1A]